MSVIVIELFEPCSKCLQNKIGGAYNNYDYQKDLFINFV